MTAKYWTSRMTIAKNSLFNQGSAWAVENVVEVPIYSDLSNPAFVYINVLSLIFRIGVNLETLFNKKTTPTGRFASVAIDNPLSCADRAHSAHQIAWRHTGCRVSAIAIAHLFYNAYSLDCLYLITYSCIFLLNPRKKIRPCLILFCGCCYF